jgi:hypothetical protein
MHTDDTSSELHTRILAGIKLQWYPAAWADHVHRITMTNVWRPRSVIHEKAPLHVNRGSNLTGILGSTLSPNWFIIRRDIPVP